MEMVAHDAPSEQQDTSELRRPSYDLKEITTFVVLEKIDAMCNPAYQMMHRFVFLYTPV
jgi:hypothetical protein